MKKDLVGLSYKDRDYTTTIIEKALDVKNNPGRYSDAMKNKTLLMLFEKPSTRTRLSFEVGMTQMGGHAIFFGKDSHLLGGKEDIHDTAKTVSRFVDLIMARVYSHKTVQDLGKYATVPVVNGLCDFEHPCQALADVMTIREIKGENAKVAYLGDGNNVCNSLMLGASSVGYEVAVATPKGFEPDPAITAKARQFSNVMLTNDPFEAVKDADVVYTDVWVSMGEEAEKEERIKIFTSYQVNNAVMGKAKKDAIFMHCLPAYKGLEVTKDVIEGPQSVVFQQAENRLHAQKAVMLDCLDYW